MTIAVTPHKIDKFIPWMFVLFFLVIAATDAVLVTLAVTTQTGVVTENAYETGLKYNDIIQDKKAQAALGWSIKTDITDAGTITIVAHDKTGAPLSNADVKILLFRPLQDGHDQSIIAKNLGGGQYQIAPNYPLLGAWRIYATITHNHDNYKFTRDYVVKTLNANK